MKPMFRRSRLSLAVALGVLAGAPPVQAQEAADAQEAASAQPQGARAQTEAVTLDNITVTARRRTESLQDVPVAVSAFGEEAMKDLQATNIDGLQGAVPNMNIVQGRGSSSAVNVFIRGIGQPDALQTFDPGVGMYVDDVYYSRIQGALFSLFDVQQIEVLRGPQGTLYGKNSTGGAIKLTTKNPFDDQGGSVELTAGDFGRWEGRWYVGVPVSERFAMSLAGAWVQNHGYVSNPDNHEDYNDERTGSLRAKLAFRPTEGVEATLSLDYTDQDNGLTLGAPTAPLTQTDFLLGTVVLLQPEEGEYDFRSRTSFAPDQGQTLTHKGAAFDLQWQFAPEWTLRSISAWRKLDTDAFVDIDASEYELGDVLVAIDQEQFSQELQLQFDDGEGLQAIFGAYYLREDVPSYQEAYADDLLAFGGLPISFLRTIDDDLETTSYAAFAHASWEFAPTWTLSGGVRYTKEEKDYFRTTSTFSDLLGNADPALAFQIDEDWSAVTPSLSLQKAFTDNVMGYVSANRGFKSGGFNGRANAATEISSFDPEYVWTYEAGLKMQSADHRLTGNLAYFHSDYEDFQARVSEVQNPDDPIPYFAFPVLNAAELKIDGVEFEGVALLGEATRLSAQVGWMDARYERFDDPRIAVDPTLSTLHEHVPFSPEWSARVALQHSFDLGGHGGLTVGADASYRSETWLAVDNRDGLRQGAYTLVGLYGVWDSPEYRWQLRAGVRNLTDEVYRTEGQEFSSVGNIQTVYYGWPRNVYASLRYNF